MPADMMTFCAHPDRRGARVAVDPARRAEPQWCTAGAGVDRVGLERCHVYRPVVFGEPTHRPRVLSAQVPLMGDGQPWYRHVLRDPAVPLEALEQISDDIQVRSARLSSARCPSSRCWVASGWGRRLCTHVQQLRAAGVGNPDRFSTAPCRTCTSARSCRRPPRRAMRPRQGRARRRTGWRRQGHPSPQVWAAPARLGCNGGSALGHGRA